jgi:DNA-binding MarR family transcriptional regulator
MSIKIMSRVWSESSAEGSSLLLLLAIADHADDNGFAFPGIDTLAEKIRMTAQSVRNLTKKLEDIGELVKISRTDKGRSNLYIVTTGISDNELKAARDRAEDFGGGKIFLPPPSPLWGDKAAILQGGKIAVMGGGKIASLPDPSDSHDDPSDNHNSPKSGKNELDTFFPRPTKELKDPLQVVAESGWGQRGPGNTVTAEAGGADDWHECVSAFADTIGIDHKTLPDRTRRQWSRRLQKIANEWGVGPPVLREVIVALPGSEEGWRSFASPYQAESTLGKLIGQHLSGGIRARKGANGNGAKRKQTPRRNDEDEAEIEATRAAITAMYQRRARLETAGACAST